MTKTDPVIGIDIGGTKTVVAAVDTAGRIHGSKIFATQSQRGFAVGLAELAAGVRTVLAEGFGNGAKPAGIGIGCTGPVNPITGTIHNPFTLPGWEDAEIVTALESEFKVPVRLENDADAAAVGEFCFGAGLGTSPMVMVTFGTGIGGAVLVRGQIQRGANGEHPELGHLTVEPDGPECYCGSRGCWESLASGTAIGLAGKDRGFDDSRAIFAASPNDPRAAAIIEHAMKATASATWTLLHTILPERIIIGGGIGEAHFDIFAEVMRAQVARATQVPRDKVTVAKAQLGQEAGVIGAAALMMERGKQ